MTPRKPTTSHRNKRAAVKKAQRTKTFVQELAERLSAAEDQATLLQDRIEELPQGSAEHSAAESQYDAGLRHREALESAIATARPATIGDVYLQLGCLQKRLGDGVPGEEDLKEIEGTLVGVRELLFRWAKNVPAAFGQNRLGFGIPMQLSLDDLRRTAESYEVALGRKSRINSSGSGHAQA